MKITSSDHLEQILGPRKQAAGLHEDQGFSKLLEEKSASAQDRPAAAQAAPLMENNALWGQIMASRKVNEAQPTPRRQLENALDQMEQYAEALGDRGRSLKDLEPLANGLNQTAGRLSELSRKLPEGDPLKDIANEAAVLATVEAMKFRRGDYV
ncbi:MAG: hypothetical protein LBP33_08825 [Candidatus Adiutrix sp.]|jgi:hypothetical protein|nr:hypothetical protein [Candidatus Adiutrix sp.]